MDWNISSSSNTGYNFTASDVSPKGEDFGGRYDDYGYDLSLHDYPEKFEPQPIWLMVIKIIIYVVLILVAIAGNMLVILVVIKNKRMRTTTNFYMVNLAISDLMVTSWCSWVHLVDDFTQGWVLGDFFCKFNSFAQVTSLVSSILSLTLIAFDRFFGIVFAMKAHIIERKARTSLVIVWILSIIVGAPLLHIRQVEKRQWKNHLERWCDGNWTLENFGMTVNKNITDYPVFYRPARVAYWTLVSLVLFLIPIIGMFAAYFGIIKTLWTAKAPGERLKGEITVQTKMKRKVVVMLIAILTIFTVCWFPLQIAILYAEYRPNQIEQLGRWYTGFTFFAKTLAFSNSAINPLIYAGFNDNFRQDLSPIENTSDKLERGMRHRPNPLDIPEELRTALIQERNDIKASQRRRIPWLFKVIIPSSSVYSNSDFVLARMSKRKFIQEMFVNKCVKFRRNRIKNEFCRAVTPKILSNSIYSYSDLF